jgi:sulfur-carrier protein
MEVTLKYFAWVRERVGAGEERAVLPENVRTAGDTIEWLRQRGGGYAAAFARPEVIRVAIDQMHAPHTAFVKGAREIAFFPPVTGG